MGSTISEFIELIVDAIIYIVAISLIAVCVRNLVTNSYGVARYENVNTTISQTDGEPETCVGYTDAGGNDIFEGTLTGSCVFEEIISADEHWAVAINGTDIPAAELDSYRRSSDGKAVLRGRLDLDRNYYRKYSTDAYGVVSAVDYIEY